jgi:TRAP-type mannitol/chloroaromatic compound transport system permease large subunit
VSVTSAATAKVNGTVMIFTSSNWPIASGTLNASGTVSWTVPKSLTGLTIYALYVGNSTYAASTSTQLNGPAVLASLQ